MPKHAQDQARIVSASACRPHMIGIEKDGVRYQHVADQLPQWLQDQAA